MLREKIMRVLKHSEMKVEHEKTNEKNTMLKTEDNKMLKDHK